eukprot:PhM_4_TR15662/c8_g2_i1/m.3405
MHQEVFQSIECEVPTDPLRRPIAALKSHAAELDDMFNTLASARRESVQTVPQTQSHIFALISKDMGEEEEGPQANTFSYLAHFGTAPITTTTTIRPFELVHQYLEQAKEGRPTEDQKTRIRLVRILELEYSTVTSLFSLLLSHASSSFSSSTKPSTSLLLPQQDYVSTAAQALISALILRALSIAVDEESNDEEGVFTVWLHSKSSQASATTKKNNLFHWASLVLVEAMRLWALLSTSSSLNLTTTAQNDVSLRSIFQAIKTARGGVPFCDVVLHHHQKKKEKQIDGGDGHPLEETALIKLLLKTFGVSDSSNAFIMKSLGIGTSTITTNNNNNNANTNLLSTTESEHQKDSDHKNDDNNNNSTTLPIVVKRYRSSSNISATASTNPNGNAIFSDNNQNNDDHNNNNNNSIVKRDRTPSPPKVFKTRYR